MAYTRPLGSTQLEQDVLKADKRACRKFGPCGVGKEALYLNSFYLDRRYYVPFSVVTRVFKRVAMSKGGFTGKGIFATMPYLVVVYENGQEKQCLFKREEQVDEMISYIKERHPHLKFRSEAVEKKMEERAAKEAAKVYPPISSEAKEEIQRLERAGEYLERRPALYEALTRCAKAKRVNERSNPAYRWVALAIVVMGALAAVYGVYALVTKAGFGIYFTLFGLAAIFLFSGANVLPTKQHNRAYVEKQWQDACEAMERHIRAYPQFPLPARYAHPSTLDRMIRVIREARADTAQAALEEVKADLKRMNADVQVEQEEYDEIMSIKPMFLVENYR